MIRGKTIGLIDDNILIVLAEIHIASDLIVNTDMLEMISF